MKTLATHYPFLSAIAVTCAGVLSQLWPFWVPGLSLTALILLARGSAVIVAVGLLASLGWWAEAGFGRPANWRVILPYLPLACVGLGLPLLAALLTGSKVTAPGEIALGLLS